MTGPAIYQFLLAFSVLVFGVMLAVAIRSGRASLFHPVVVYLAFHAVVFVVRPILAHFYNYDGLYEAYDFVPSWDDKITVLLATNLGLVAFVFSSLVFGRAVPRFAAISDAQYAAHVKPLILTCMLTGVPAIWSLVSNFTGESQRVFDQETMIVINTTESGYFLDAQLMLATLVGMIAFVFRFRWWSLLPFAAYVFVKAGTGGRGPFIAAAFFLVLLYLFQQRRRWLTAFTTLLSIAALALFRLVGDDRGESIQAMMGFTPANAFEKKELGLLESMDWANLEFFEFLVYAIPQRTGSYDYFASLLQVFTEPIPRMFWADKPVGAPIKFFNLFDYGFPIGMTYSLPGTGWMELGWLGVIIMCVAFAWIYGRSYSRFMNSRQTPVAVMIYCAFATTSIVAFRDGMILSILKQSLFYLAPVVVFAGVQRAYSPRGADFLKDGHSSGERAMSPKERRRARMRQLERTA